MVASRVAPAAFVLEFVHLTSRVDRLMFSSQPCHYANAFHCPTLPRAVVESVHKLDVIIGSKASYREVFKPENISLRNKYVQLSQQCEREEECHLHLTGYKQSEHHLASNILSLIMH